MIYRGIGRIKSDCHLGTIGSGVKLIILIVQIVKFHFELSTTRRRDCGTLRLDRFQSCWPLTNIHRGRILAQEIGIRAVIGAREGNLLVGVFIGLGNSKGYGGYMTSEKSLTIKRGFYLL